MPAKAGIQTSPRVLGLWIPAFAGMTQRKRPSFRMTRPTGESSGNKGIEEAVIASKAKQSRLSRVLGARRDLLHLRLEHERPDLDPFHFALRGFRVASVTAASMLAMMGIFDFFGTIASGWLSDRYDNRALLFMYYGLRGLSLLYLPGSSFTVYGLSLFAVFYGLDWIATVPPTVRLAAQCFGRSARASPSAGSSPRT